MNIKPDFDIHNEDPLAEDPAQCRLLLEIGNRSVNFILLNVRGMRPVAIRVYQWAGNGSPDDESLREIFENDSILNSFKPAEIFLVYNYPESNLVPEKYFGSDIARPVTDLVYGNVNQDLILDEKIPWFEFHNVYRVPAPVHFLLQEKFSSARYWHFYSLQLKCFKMFTAREEPAFIKAFIYPDKMIVMVSKNGQLQLIQHFAYLDYKDVLYHLLNCCQQLGLSPSTLSLELAGMVERKSALFEDLEMYFMNVRFDHMEDSIKITDELLQYPHHFFSSLLKMTICV